MEMGGKHKWWMGMGDGVITIDNDRLDDNQVDR